MMLVALVATTAFAQANAQQSPAAESAKPPALTVAPDGPQKPEATASRDQSRSSGGPSNICGELVAYLKSQDRPKGASQPRPGGQATGPGQTAPPMDRPQQQSGQSAPIPPSDQSSGAPQLTVAQAEDMLQAGDLRACQRAAREMRRAGVPLPPGLMALAALREDLLQRSESQSTTR
jgi:hypothetical protein